MGYKKKAAKKVIALVKVSRKAVRKSDKLMGKTFKNFKLW